MPFIVDEVIRTGKALYEYQVSVWIFIVVCLVLGYIGGKAIASPYYEIGKFLHFAILATC